MSSKILIIGACGQIGSELTARLRSIYGIENVIASDISYNNSEVVNSGLFQILDANNYTEVKKCVDRNKIHTVYLMAAMLSAVGEKYPMKAWDLNMNTLFHVLNLAKEGFIKKVFWPSSIAVFGPTTPKENTAQRTIMEPSTVYGITKQVGERWCEYYFNNYNVDVRSLRYPGLISYKTKPGGGTTDYAVEIYYEALKTGQYECFLSKDTRLPMMYMDDAIEGTLQLMDAPAEKIKIRSSYNLGAVDFTPEEIAATITENLPDFKISYNPDFRQAIADSWPQSIDDSIARQDWDWKPKFTLKQITDVMLTNIKID
ncbi:NAD-dependent epimerase/dehydratase family protein [Aegicerativicinus sediminis]|uniref:NAD-dependent epimerase/dehydratase family protein n=1 Tax=Aegicerativicinus sediminis TaxID=2893202 RepID=UPI001E3880A1|nr:NAD-dependent epimerase/dehydratase family protein [Aegicerativicinus sediminis]